MLIGLFEGIYLSTYVAKTLAIVCQYGNISGQYSAAAYGRHMTDKGYPQHVRNLRRVVYGEYVTDLAASYTATHIYMHHSRS